MTIIVIQTKRVLLGCLLSINTDEPDLKKAASKEVIMRATTLFAIHGPTKKVPKYMRASMMACFMCL